MLTITAFRKEHRDLFETRAIERELDMGFGGDPFGELFERHPAWTAWADGKPVFCAGCVVLWPGVGEIWARSSAWVEQHPIAFHRTVVNFLESTAATLKLWRMQVNIEAIHHVSRAWVQRMGFVDEGLHTALGPRGQDFYHYSRIWFERIPKREAA